MKPPLHGLILAGGRSARMGRDKATLLHSDGRTLARRCADLLVQAGCQTVVISLRQDQEVPAGLEDLLIVRDPVGESLGPMVGMVTGMKQAPQATWLVVACDLPRLDVSSLSHLVDSLQPGEKFLAYRSEFDGLPEPLCALYTAEALPVLAAAQAADFRCPRKILIREDCRVLEPISPRALENANTPEDWEIALQP
jgi:molybdopterin-guanine dinucleotide biosynthesis protein A